MSRFLTVPDELIEAAEAAIEHYEHLGYNIDVEAREPGFPFVPAFVARRRPTTIIVEVASNFDQSKIEKWCRFGRSCATDTQVCLVVPSNSVALTKLEIIHGLHVGVCVADDQGAVREILAPHDLAMIMELPVLDDCSVGVRRALGPAYEQINRGHWREAFETACLGIEAETRGYLWLALSKRQRLTIRDKNGNPRTFVRKQIMKATLGRLGVLLNSASPHNELDALLATNIPLINRQRIDVAHYKYRREALLRRHVRRHMWTIFQCLEEML